MSSRPAFQHVVKTAAVSKCPLWLPDLVLVPGDMWRQDRVTSGFPGPVETQGRGHAQEWCPQVVGVLSLGCCAVENMSLHYQPLVWPVTL